MSGNYSNTSTAEAVDYFAGASTINFTKQWDQNPHNDDEMIHFPLPGTIDVADLESSESKPLFYSKEKTPSGLTYTESLTPHRNFQVVRDSEHSTEVETLWVQLFRKTQLEAVVQEEMVQDISEIQLRFDYQEASNFINDVVDSLDNRRQQAAQAESEYWQFLDEEL